ncbi:MAG: GAF domain-containing protein [Elusimicrobiota bacterium]|jgi:PAS domain-containing protein
MTGIDRLYDVLEFLSTLREPEDAKVWSRVLEKTAASLGAASGGYLCSDAKTRLLTPFHAVGAEASSRVPVPSGEGICGWVARYREPALVADTASEPRYRRELDGPARTLMCLPVFDRLDFAGALVFADKDGGPFTPEDLRFAATVVQQTAMTLRRLRLEGMLNRVTAYNSSILDNLSGGFIAVDLRGHVMICNPAARRILAVQGDVTDLPIENALPNLPDLAAVLRLALSSKQTVKRRDLPWKLDGNPRLLGYSTLLIQDADGKFTGVGVTFQDITKPAAA